jgi:hypothetical protein
MDTACSYNGQTTLTQATMKYQPAKERNLGHPLNRLGLLY